MCIRKQDGRGKKEKKQGVEGRTGNESPAPFHPVGGKLDLFVSAGFLLLSASRCALLQ